MEDLHIVLAPETLWNFFGVPITNTLVTAWVVAALLIAVGITVGRRVALVPGKVQTAFETVFSFALAYIEETLGDKDLAKKFFPLLLSIFLFILFANLLEFMPGIGSVGFYESETFSPLFRSVNTDFNVTLALAVIAFLVIEVTGIAVLGILRYGKKFVNVSSVLGFAMGIMELVSEVARLISFSFRLFGNVFAGEVLIMVAIAFLPAVLPVPLMLFEIFVGFIQAAIFALLTLFFVKIAIMEPHPSH